MEYNIKIFLIPYNNVYKKKFQRFKKSDYFLLRIKMLIFLSSILEKLGNNY